MMHFAKSEYLKIQLASTTNRLVLYNTTPQGLVLALKMVLIITKDKIKEFLAAGNDIVVLERFGSVRFRGPFR